MPDHGQVLILKNFKDMPADEITVEFWMRSTGEHGMMTVRAGRRAPSGRGAAHVWACVKAKGQVLGVE